MNASVNEAVKALGAKFAARCEGMQYKKGTVKWTNAQLEFIIGAAQMATVLNEHELAEALTVRAALLASFGRDAFEVKEKKA